MQKPFIIEEIINSLHKNKTSIVFSVLISISQEKKKKPTYHENGYPMLIFIYSHIVIENA